MNRLDILLLDGFHFDESHIRTAHRLADRLSVIGVIFITLDVPLCQYSCRSIFSLSNMTGGGK